jgi:hypothetical protein
LAFFDCANEPRVEAAEDSEKFNARKGDILEAIGKIKVD